MKDQLTPLDEEIAKALGHMNDAEFGSEDYYNYLTVYEHLMKTRATEQDQIFKTVADVRDREQKAEEAEKDRKSRFKQGLIDVGKAVGVAAIGFAGFAVQAWLHRKETEECLEFEETGCVKSHASRQVVGKVPNPRK